MIQRHLILVLSTQSSYKDRCYSVGCVYATPEDSQCGCHSDRLGNHIVYIHISQQLLSNLCLFIYSHLGKSKLVLLMKRVYKTW